MILFRSSYYYTLLIKELKLAQWEPMEVDEFEMHKLASQNYMQNAINANRHVDNILSNIITIADKIQLTKNQLFKYSDDRISGNFCNILV